MKITFVQNDVEKLESDRVIKAGLSLKKAKVGDVDSPTQPVERQQVRGQGDSSVRQLLAEEYRKKVDEGQWPGIPFECEVKGDLESEGPGEALEQYNAKHPYDYLVADGCDWEEL